MHQHSTPSATLIDTRVNTKLKLAALWASFTMLYIYVDYFHLYMPQVLSQMMAGKVFVFSITPGFLVAALCSITIPTLMMFLSTALPATANRYTNLTLAIIYIPYTLFNLVGTAWPHMIIAAIVEVLLLCLIIHYAWSWPRHTPNS